MNTIFLVSAIAVSALANPAETYHSWFAPEITETICDYIANEEYHAHVDYNGDGQLSIADAVCVSRRYEENCDFGNEITVDFETVNAIAEENFNAPVMEWEFCEINNEITCEYQIITSEIISATIRYEFEDFSVEYVEIEINPFEEKIKVVN